MLTKKRKRYAQESAASIHVRPRDVMAYESILKTTEALTNLRTRLVAQLSVTALPMVLYDYICGYLEREVAFVIDTNNHSYATNKTTQSLTQTVSFERAAKCWLWDPWSIPEFPPILSEQETRMIKWADESVSHSNHRQQMFGSSGDVRPLPTLVRSFTLKKPEEFYKLDYYTSTLCAMVTVYPDVDQPPLILLFDNKLPTIAVYDAPSLVTQAYSSVTRDTNQHETWPIPDGYQRASTLGYVVCVDPMHPWRVYIVGWIVPSMENGLNLDDELSSFYGLRIDCLDTRTRAWTVVSRLSTHTHRYGSVIDIQKILCDGQRQRLYMLTASAHTYCYDLTSGTWILPVALPHEKDEIYGRDLPPVLIGVKQSRMPPRRTTAGKSAAIIFHDRLLVAGGQDPNFSYSETAACESLSLVDAAPTNFEPMLSWSLRESTRLPVFCTMQNRLYAIGGGHRDHVDARMTCEAVMPLMSKEIEDVSSNDVPRDTNRDPDSFHWRPLYPRTPTSWQSVLVTTINKNLRQFMDSVADADSASNQEVVGVTVKMASSGDVVVPSVEPVSACEHVAPPGAVTREELITNGVLVELTREQLVSNGTIQTCEEVVISADTIVEVPSTTDPAPIGGPPVCGSFESNSDNELDVKLMESKSRFDAARKLVDTERAILTSLEREQQLLRNIKVPDDSKEPGRHVQEADVHVVHDQKSEEKTEIHAALQALVHGAGPNAAANSETCRKICAGIAGLLLIAFLIYLAVMADDHRRNPL